MGDIKIGGGGSCYIYARVGQEGDHNNPPKSTALFDDCGDVGLITVALCGKTVNDWNAALTEAEKNGKTLQLIDLNKQKLWIHWTPSLPPAASPAAVSSETVQVNSDPERAPSEQ
jgi:hypothetical protein